MLSNYSRNFAKAIKWANLLEGDFKFGDMGKVKAIMARYPKDQPKASILPLLQLGQEENGGYVTKGVVSAVSEITGQKWKKVHETVSFYHNFRFKPPRKHCVERCNGLPCFLKNTNAIKQAIEKATNGTFEKGGSSDGEFDLYNVECLGACANAPVMVVDGVYYQDLDEKKIEEIIKRVKAGKDASELCAQSTGPARSLLA